MCLRLLHSTLYVSNSFQLVSNVMWLHTSPPPYSAEHSRDELIDFSAVRLVLESKSAFGRELVGHLIKQCHWKLRVTPWP